MPSSRQLFVAASCSLSSWLAFSLPSTVGAVTTNVAAVDSFNWMSIDPSPDLVYHDCYEEYKCARLEVPLDWKDPNNTQKAIIAITKLPAVVPDDDPAFAGPLFTNPGGPGGSGVQFMLMYSHHLRHVADKPGKRHYEIISFDPRGIANTRPRSDCFGYDNITRDAFLLELRANGPITGSSSAIAYNLALMEAFGKRCAMTSDDLRYMGTPNVARDMVEMLDKIHELRKKEARDAKRNRGSDHGQGQSHDDEAQVELKRSAGASDEDLPRLQYIGFSYGTVLGNFFASMFPGRVGRIIVDGVVNADDYVGQPGWLTSTVDADEMVELFIKGCAAAGPEVCALAREGDKGPSEVRARYNSILDKLDGQPVSYVNVSGNMIIITGDDIRRMVINGLYTPIPGFIDLAKTLNSTFSGDFMPAARIVVSKQFTPPLRHACPVDGQSPEPIRGEAQHAVVCIDAANNTDKPVYWWKDYADKQRQVSSTFASYWTHVRLYCAGWKFTPNWIFPGPFTTPPHDPSLKPHKPAAPLLFLSNRYDPVTPLSSARAMAARHPGARVVIQEAMGHCALISAQSKCITNTIADYLDTGLLVDGEVTCEAECGPWDKGCQPIKPGQKYDAASLSSLEHETYVHDSEYVLRSRELPLGIW